MPANDGFAERPVLSIVGRPPKEDGDVNYYHVPRYELFFHPEAMPPGSRRKLESRHRGRRVGAYPVVYVNGMGGSPDKHRAQACAVSAISGGGCFGVFNASSGGAKDFLQCLSDKATSSFLMEARSLWGKATGLFRGDSAQNAQRILYEHLRSHNVATAKLFRLLCRPHFANARIVAHSQGNLITSNALNALIALRDESAIQKMHVLAIASPTFFWGDAKPRVKSFSFANDGVGWLSGNFMIGKERKNQTLAPAVGMGYSAVEAPRTAMISGYKKQPWYKAGLELSTHSFYIYLTELWDALRHEFH